MTILVIADFLEGKDGKVLAPATLNTVAAAAKIGGDINVHRPGRGGGRGAGAQPARADEQPDHCGRPHRRRRAIGARRGAVAR